MVTTINAALNWDNCENAIGFLSYSGSWWSFNTAPVPKGYHVNAVIDTNANSSQYVGAAGDYPISNGYNGGEYVNRTRPRYNGKAMSFKVLYRLASCAEAYNTVSNFVQGLTAGIYFLRIRRDYVAFDLRLSGEADVKFNKDGREAIISFTLVSSYPYLIDARLTNNNAIYDSDKSDYFQDLGVNLNGQEIVTPVYSGIPVLFGNSFTQNLMLRVSTRSRYFQGDNALEIFNMKFKTRIPAEGTNIYFVLGGNLLLTGINQSTGNVLAPYSPIDHLPSMGYPLTYASERVTYSLSANKLRLGLGRVYL